MHFKISNIPYYKWFLIFKVILFNIAVVSIILIAMYPFVNFGSVASFRSYYPTYFYPLNRFDYFFINTAWQAALSEETYYRSPIWILSASGFTLSIKGRRFDDLFIWSAIIIPTIFWTCRHDSFNLPVFIVGVSWGWLVSRTRSLWPAIISHMTANIIIYFALKILLLFVKI